MSGSTNGPTSRVWLPSTSRRVVVDGFLPVPRGSVPAPPSLPAWPAKDPGDTLDYELDLSPALLGNEQDSIATVIAAVQPVDTLAVGQAAGDGTSAVLWISGGNVGTTYAVRVTVTMVTGRVIARTVLLAVESLAPTMVPPSTTSALVGINGLTITDQSGAPILVSD